MNLLRRRWLRGFVAVAAASLAVLGISQVTSSATTKAQATITLTEMDYYSTAAQTSMIASYIKEFEAANPGVTIQATHVPFSDLDTKLLTDASAHDLPNILAVDNPFVPDMIATGQMLPLSGFAGFTTSGYYPAVMNEGLSGGKYYTYPVGANSIALFYNIKMLKAAHVSPPKTWAQLLTAAKKLTTKTRYGVALTAEAAEDCTWQWEPFFWSNGGNFSSIASAPGVQALSLWTQLVTAGSASKAALSWSQTPDVTDQFLHGQTAMMFNGPWNFAALNAQGWYYGKQFGIVSIPVREAGQKVAVPLGGEDWMISNSGSSAQQQMAFKFLQGMQTPSEMLAFVKAFGYLPAKISVAATFLKEEGPEWSVFIKQTLTAHPRTLGLGVKYTKISEDVWTAILSCR